MTIDFNSRTHVECDIGLTTTERRLFISTHALTWSATCTESIFSRQSSGFQLTHSRGVRRYAQSRKICQESFQLTHSRGVRPFSDSPFPFFAYFNSRTHVECDISDTIPNVFGLDFNSRTHVECDLAICFILCYNGNFNSRTHVECDHRSEPCAASSRISTHALTWSATCRLYRQRKIKKFQLTHSRGVRRELNGCFELYLDFNSRTHVECDSLVPSNVPDTRDFNSRTHVECDCWRCRLDHAESDFNSRTHVECDSKYCIKKRFATQYMGSHCFLSSIILIFFIYSKK